MLHASVVQAFQRLSPWPAQTDSGYNRLIERLSDRLYREALGSGGSAAEVGVLGPAAFAGEANRILTAVSLGATESGPPLP